MRLVRRKKAFELRECCIVVIFSYVPWLSVVARFLLVPVSKVHWKNHTTVPGIQIIASPPSEAMSLSFGEKRKFKC